MYSYSEGNSFEEILQRCLARVDDSLDKRQGSIIYDAIAPICAELAQAYIALDIYTDQTYLGTTTGNNLDNKVVDYGLSRNAATYAKRLATVVDINGDPMDIDIGTRFSIPNEYGGYNFAVTQKYSTGTYILTCETAGIVGNDYFGILLPLQTVNNLGTATLGDVYIAGEDVESDDSLRQRAIDKISQTPFGGNIADYKEYTKSLDGVGECLVVPVWNGGGTVKLVILTTSYDIPTPALIDTIQTLVDPLVNSGIGLGKAPIGHQVTVAAPTAYELTIETDISVESSVTVETLREDIENAINEYILSVQKQWADSTTVIIYVSRLIAAIVTVPGVTNAENLTINGSENNLIIDVTAAGNPYPIIKEVILNET